MYIYIYTRRYGVVAVGTGTRLEADSAFLVLHDAAPPPALRRCVQCDMVRSVESCFAKREVICRKESCDMVHSVSGQVLQGVNYVCVLSIMCVCCTVSSNAVHGVTSRYVLPVLFCKVTSHVVQGILPVTYLARYQSHIFCKVTIHVVHGIEWRRVIGSPQLQIISRKKPAKYRSLLRKMTYKDKGSYESWPPFIMQGMSFAARCHVNPCFARC